MTYAELHRQFEDHYNLKVTSEAELEVANNVEANTVHMTIVMKPLDAGEDSEGEELV